MTTEKEEELKKELREILSGYDVTNLSEISIEYYSNSDNSAYDGYIANLVMNYVFYSDLEAFKQKWYIPKIEGAAGEAVRIWLIHKKASV